MHFKAHPKKIKKSVAQNLLKHILIKIILGPLRQGGGGSWAVYKQDKAQMLWWEDTSFSLLSQCD